MNKQLRTAGRLWILFAAFLITQGAWAQTPVPLASQPNVTYTESFSDVANWTNGFAAGSGANRFGSIAIGGTATIPDPTRITTSSTAFVAGASGGVQKGTGALILLSTGATDNTSSVAVDFFVDFTGVNAGRLSFDAASVANGTGNRPGTIRVYGSVDGTTFTDLGANFSTNNNGPGSAAVSVTIPATFNNVPTARFRFYYYNGGVNLPGPTGSRPKISIDNLTVTGVTGPPAPSTASVTLSIDTDGVTELPAQTVMITATASATSATEQTVTLTPTGSATNGTDYSLTNTIITIPAGQLFGSVALTTTDDVISEGPENITLTISATSSGLTTGNPAAQTINISDNDAAGLTVVESNGNTAVTEGGATDTYTVVLNTQPTSDVTVTLTPDAQVGVNPTTLTFTAANYNVAQTVTVTAADDATVEGTHNGIIQQTVTGGGTYNGVTVASVTAVIMDNDAVAIPTLIAAPMTLSGFSTTQGSPSTTQSYTLTGGNLSDPVAVSAPAGFQVSQDGISFQDQLTVPLTSGSISATIAVRLTSVSAGSQSGTITNVSGPASASVAVSGQVNTPAPALTAMPMVLSGFSTIQGTPSTPQIYTLTGTNLTASVSVTAPAGFQVSTDGTSFQDQLTVPAMSGSVSATIAVRMTGAATGSFSGSITNVSSTASADVTVSGQVNAPAATPVLTANPTTLSNFSTTQGTASAPQTFTVSGSDLSPSSITVTAPQGYEVSLDETTAYSNRFTFGNLPNTINVRVYVRLSINAVASSVSGNVAITGSNGTSANVSVSGQVSAPAPSNGLYYNLSAAPLTQNWSNTGLITANDSWTSVQSIIGYLGDEALTTTIGADPQTVLGGATTTIDVIANQANPNTQTAGGVAEFEITNPTVALQGSGTADAPHLIVYLNTTGVSNISVAYNVRDIDGSADNAAQQVALQYRIGESGNFTNIPDGFVFDATSGPSSATQVTAVNVTLPAEANNQSQVQLRIITVNAPGSDEWVGIDDIVISGSTGGVVTPTVTVQATDASAAEMGADPGVFTITRTGSTTAPATVNYTVSGQATAGTDYTPTLSGSVTIDAGQTTATITITPIDDALLEGNETVVLSLTTGDGYTVNSPRSATITIADNDIIAGAVRIRDIQGSGHISPLAGTAVTNIPGIVTALRNNGFWIQDATPDADDNTSEGIFVFTSSASGRTVGESVLVSGTVQEFRANVQNLSITQITGPMVNLVSSNNVLPAPIVISSQVAAGGRRIPTNVISNDYPASGDVELSTFDPAEDGLDFYETLEGMRVQINNPVTTSFRNGNGEVFVIADRGAGATGLNSRGTLTISGTNTIDINSAITNSDFNPERIQIDDVLYGTGNTPNMNVGTLLNTIIGVVSYDFQNVEILPSIAPTVSASNVPLTKETTNLLPTSNQLTIASFNVENLGGNEDQAKFDGLALGIKNNLGSPDILALEEIQDNNGATNDGVVDATTTLNRLIAAI